MNNREKIEHKVVTIKSVVINHPTKFLHLDAWLEKPTSFLGFSKSKVIIRGVTSRMLVFNVSMLHVSFEIFPALQAAIITESEGNDDELHVKTPSGDG